MAVVGCSAGPDSSRENEPVEAASPTGEDPLPEVGDPDVPAPSPDEAADTAADDKNEGRGRPAEVLSVTDGDTVVVSYRGQEADVRLIGIDTPETLHPSQGVECFGEAASAFTRRKIEGQPVGLELDVERYDQYGRLLAYIWRGHQLFNERLVRRGFATVATYPPNVKYVDRFLAAERSARKHRRGLWDACPSGEGAEPDAGGSGKGKPGAGRCDPSYPDVCIPPYPPDLDCARVPYKNFRVQGSDPHGFDGDSDGFGCES